MSAPPLPKRVFTAGDRKMVGVRLPESLVRELNRLAEESGWTLTDVIQTALDQFVQSNTGDQERRRPLHSPRTSRRD